MRLTTPDQLAELLGIPFSAQQLAAIAAPLEPAVIIAGAGSGKTTVMAARVVWLVGSQQVRADQVLGLTFTRKAAGELGARVRRALREAGVVDPDGAEELILTYDAFAGRLVAEHGLLLGMEAGMRMITGAARYRLAARAVADAPGPLRYLSRLRPTTVTERVVELSSEMRSHLVGPVELAGHAEIFAAALDAAPKRGGSVEYKAVLDARAAEGERRELAELVVSYEKLKTELGYVEFADQMAAAARLATEVPSVGAALREEFAVVLLDEYQDTSAAQAALLRGLFSGMSADAGRGHPVTAVGDPCQAIYGWRGAAASNILDFAHHFPQLDGGPAVSYALTVNRRSGQRVLDAANQLAAPVRADPALTAHGLDLDLVAPPEAPPGRVEAEAFVTWPEEVVAIADRIADLHATAAVPAWSDVAVLCRRNSHVAAVYAALVARDVPAEIVGLGGLLDLPAVADVVATLTVLADATANPSTVRLLTSPRWAIGIPDLALLGRRARDLIQDKAAGLEDPAMASVVATEATLPSLLEALADPGSLPYSREARARFAAFTAEISGLRRHAGEAVTELVARVIAVLGLPVETESVESGGSAVLSAFVQAVAGYTDIDAEASLAGLLAWLEAERKYGIGLDQAVISAADSVKVLTVHKAKGLEWEVVFVPGLAATVFPTDRVTGNWLRNASALPYPLRGDANALPQLGAVDHQKMAAFGEALTGQQRLSEDRLAYVAVTRARQLLLASTHAWAATLTRPRLPSAYFQALCEHADQVSLVEEMPAVNPLLVEAEHSAWPAVGGTDSFELRRIAAERVEAARAQRVATGAYPQASGLDLDGVQLVSGWRQAGAALLVAEAADRKVRSAGVPDYLSVTGLSQLARDPQAFAVGLRRPMPRLVNEAQRWGIGFHRWLENRFAQQSSLLDEEPELELAGAVFDKLREGFETGPYAAVTPVAVETPFTLVLAGRLIRGRIDAVFNEIGGRMQVVDWKSGNATAADPLQLACYRLAWAELNGLSIDQVDAVFYDLHTGKLVRPERLPDRAELEELVVGRLGQVITPGRNTLAR
jgi:DNA helicase II / ATP-dependent DNA helicase PcrA